MATSVTHSQEGGAHVYVLSAGKNESTDPIEIAGARNVSVQFRRTNGSTQTATLQGSNNGSVWVTLNGHAPVASGDGYFVALTGQTAGLYGVVERPRYMRLTVSNESDGADDVLEAVVVAA